MQYGIIKENESGRFYAYALCGWLFFVAVQSTELSEVIKMNDCLIPVTGHTAPFSFAALGTEQITKHSLIRYHLFNMINKETEMLEWKGLPETIPNRVINLQGIVYGYRIIFKHEGKLYSTFGGLGGQLDYNYMPTIATIANPALKISKQLKIGKDCVVIPNDALYLGLMPINKYYAKQLTENDLTMNSTLIITRLMNILTAPNEDIKKSLQDVIKALEEGKLDIAVDDDLILEGIKSLPFSDKSSTNIVQLLEHRQYVKGSWWNEIGVQSNYNMKRETITSSENILNVDSLLPLSDSILRYAQLGCDEVNKMFGTNWSVDFSSSWKKVRTEISTKERLEEAQVQSTELQTKNEGEDKDDNEEQS